LPQAAREAAAITAASRSDLFMAEVLCQFGGLKQENRLGSNLSRCDGSR
jgi:hypothetical protein